MKLVEFTYTEFQGGTKESSERTAKCCINPPQVMIVRESGIEGKASVVLHGGLAFTVDGTYQEVRDKLNAELAEPVIEQCLEYTAHKLNIDPSKLD